MHFRNPILGNTFGQDSNVLIRELPSGQTVIIADHYWPKVERLHVEFRGLKSDVREELLDFYRSVAGVEIQLKDHENTDWTGFIIDTPVIKREADNCMYYTQFTFEGNKV